uniref:glycosyltransferase family 2 protein n=1 Tax=Pseudomonas asplenii TaxID=53407 RepID=UPI0012F88FB3
MTQPAESPAALDISIVVPVYRAEHTVHELYQRLISVLESMNVSFELIFIEDSGGDQCWKILQQIASNDERVRGIKFSRNFGQHAATICGFSKSTGRWIITLDDDLEQAPEHIPSLYKKAQEGADLVYGVYQQRTHSRWRNITSTIARWMFKKAIPSLNYAYTSYRVIRGDIARAVTQFDSPYPFVDGYLSWLTNNYTTVQIPHDSRVHGTSNYTLKKLITHTINIFVTFSDIPLRVASWIGFMAFLIGASWLAVIFLSFLTGKVTVSGYASIMAGILAFGGIQLLVLGIFGEYLGRINFKSSKKPLYLVRESTERDISTTHR